MVCKCVCMCVWARGDRQRLCYLECVKYLESEILYLWSNLWIKSVYIYLYYIYFYSFICVYIFLVFLLYSPILLVSPILHMWYCPIWSHYWSWASVHHFQSFFSIVFRLNRICSYLQVYWLFFHNVESASSLIQWNFTSDHLFSSPGVYSLFLTSYFFFHHVNFFLYVLECGMDHICSECSIGTILLGLFLSRPHWVIFLSLSVICSSFLRLAILHWLLDIVSFMWLMTWSCISLNNTSLFLWWQLSCLYAGSIF